MSITRHSSNQKFLSLSVLLAATLALHASNLLVQAAPGRPAARRPASRPVQLMRQAPLTDSASGREYSARLWNRILNLWDYPNGNNHVTIVATVSADGNVEGTQVTSSPKCPEAEMAAQAAFEKAKPLEALPKGMTSAKVTMLFNSKADPHGDSSSGGSVRLDGVHSAKNSNPPAENEAESPSEAPAKSESKPEAKPESKPEAKPESKSETKSETKPSAKPAAKSEVKAPIKESKTETKTETKIESKPESKPNSAAPDEFGSH